MKGDVMPRGDGTGPAGMGPMTGRGAGFCAGYGMPGYMNPMAGWGPGPRGGRGFFGRGGGRGRRTWFWATGLTGWQRAAMGWPAYGPPAWGAPPAAPYQPTAEQELAALREQVTFMEESMKEAQERIRELEKEGEKQ
jgi:hypothetical protein